MALALLGSCGWHATALATLKPSYSVNLTFETESVALSQGQRQQIFDALEYVRSREWYAFEVALIYLNLKGSKYYAGVKELGNWRIAYVREILERTGVPSYLIYGDISDYSVSKDGSNGFIEFVGGLEPKPCRYPLVPGGFHVAPQR